MKNLLKNLAKAKNEIGAISKDSANPFFKSKYFDINALIEHVEPILLQNGLLLLQPIEDNKVKSIIFDVESGESISSSMDLPALNDPQKIGSCISYYRRYTLSSLLSIQAEDDDGNKASSKKEVEKTQAKLPLLNEAGFNFLMKEGTKAQIEEAFKTREIPTDWATQLALK